MYIQNNIYHMFFARKSRPITGRFLARNSTLSGSGSARTISFDQSSRGHMVPLLITRLYGSLQPLTAVNSLGSPRFQQRQPVVRNKGNGRCSRKIFRNKISKINLRLHLQFEHLTWNSNNLLLCFLDLRNLEEFVRKSWWKCLEETSESAPPVENGCTSQCCCWKPWHDLVSHGFPKAHHNLCHLHVIPLRISPNNCCKAAKCKPLWSPNWTSCSIFPSNTFHPPPNPKQFLTILRYLIQFWKLNFMFKFVGTPKRNKSAWKKNARNKTTRGNLSRSIFLTPSVNRGTFQWKEAALSLAIAWISATSFDL